jgi:hypothetical protein
MKVTKKGGKKERKTFYTNYDFREDLIDDLDFSFT